MDGKVTVFLIVMLLAVLRGFMQRSQVRREIEERKARGPVLSTGRRINKRRGPLVDSKNVTDEVAFDDDSD
jgi:hypothetical protein